MNRVRGFLLKHRVFRRVFGRRHLRSKAISRLAKWSRRLRTKAKAILQSGRGLMRVGQEPVLGKPEPIPKGHVAVYVGQKGRDFQRVCVPVVYCNHPLLGELLRESEKEYGFDYPGGLTIPCRVSEFQSRIEAVRCTRSRKTGRSLRIS